VSEEFEEEFDDFLAELEADQTVIEFTVTHNGQTFTVTEIMSMGYPVATVCWMIEELALELKNLVKKAAE
jgi:hypothetical protein